MGWTGRGLEGLLELGLHRRLSGSAAPFAREQVGRILVVRKDNIGDVLCTTPALRALRRAFPEAFLAILVSEHCRPVLKHNPDVDEVLVYRKAKHDSRRFGVPALWGLARVLKDLRARRFDLAIGLGRPCSRSSAWLAYASGSPWRLGYASPGLHPFPFFLNLTRDPGAKTSHEVDGCLDLLSSIGVSPAGRQLTLNPDPGAQAAIRSRLAREGVRDGAGIALVHISSRREANRWPLASFARAADLLRERFGLTIAISWAPGDAGNPLFPGDDGKAEEVARCMQGRPILLATPALDDLIAAMSLSDFVLSADGGPVHIAAALGIPLVALFGQAGITTWAPVSEKSVVLKRGGRVDLIGVDEAVEAASAVLSKWFRGRP
ncbi:MAG TPA: glycosyltransferase family 9 protein [Candidatus Methylomirabilis sp.]|nr:glycosyltransferase family 9 protein [Candidatus Methylomirabilis sp.]